MLSIAVVTMVYDEREFLPLWRSHYGRLAGLENLFIIDDGSTDGSTNDLEPSHVIRRPKSAIDQIVRSAMITNFTTSLFAYYDVVIFTDIDELLVVDPLVNVSFQQYLSRVPGKHLNAIGLNVLHRADREPDYTPNMRVLEHRHWLQFDFAYCKQLIHRSPVSYRAGFHLTNRPFNFAPGLYLFHLRAFDKRTALRRIEHRRHLEWAERSLKLGHGYQNRMDPERYIAEMYPYFAADYDTAPRAAQFNDVVISKLKGFERITSHQDLAYLERLGLGTTLFERPDRFRGAIRAASEPITGDGPFKPRLSPEQVDDLYEAALAKGRRSAEEVDRAG